MRKSLYFSMFLSIFTSQALAEEPARDPAMESFGPKVVLETVEEPEKGPINLEFTYIADFGRNFSGGGHIGNSFLGVAAARAYFDMEKLAGLKSNSVFVHLQGMHGNVPSQITQDAQIASNI